MSNRFFSAIYSLCGSKYRVYVVDNELLPHISQQYPLSPFDDGAVNLIFPIQERIISTVNIEATDHCNLRCIHCYAKMDAKKRGNLQLPLLNHIIEELVNYNSPINVKLSGGEPSLNPSIVEICRVVQTLKPVTAHKLLTNLTMPEDTLIGILKTGISLQISIYGCTYDAFHMFTSGTHKQYDAILRNLRVIPTEYIKNMHIVFHVPKYTKESASACKSFADSYGISYHIGGINYIGRAYLNNTTLEAKNALNSESYPQTILCNRICEINKICILTDGTVTPCPFFRAEDKRYVVGNINEFTLDRILASETLKRFDTLTIDDVDGCRECPLKYICSGGCSAERLTMTGSILNKYPRCNVEEDIMSLDKNSIYEVAMIKPGYFKFIKGGVIQ